MNLALAFLVLSTAATTVALTAGLALRLVAHRDAIARYWISVGTLVAACIVPFIPLLLPIEADQPDSRVSTSETRPNQLSMATAPSPRHGTLRTSFADSAGLEFSRFSARAHHLSPVLLSFYAVGVTLLLFRYVIRLIATHRLLRDSESVSDSAMVDQLEIAKRRIGCQRRVALLRNTRILGTACTGILAPKVLVPAHIQAESSDLECALLHEMVHIKRYDGAVAAAQALLQMLCWFNPTVWIFNRYLDQDRETSCDATVVRHTELAHTYATALLNFFDRHHATPACFALQSFYRQGSSRFIRRRLKMLKHATDRTPRLVLLAITTLGLAIVVSSVMLQSKAMAQLGQRDDAAGATVTEVHAPDGDRSDGTVGRKWRSLAERPEFGHLKKLFARETQAGMTIRDQETLVSTPRGLAEGTTLTARDAHVNLPEGSKLYARLNGDRIEMQPAESATELSIKNGYVSVFDEQSVERIRVSTASGGSLLATMRLAHNEVNFQFTALDTEHNPADVKIETDFTTGIPEGEDDAPHGAVRYAPHYPEGWGEAKVKIQWVYEASKLRDASM